MPRKAGIGATEVIHHIIIRGIKRIFMGQGDLHVHKNITFVMVTRRNLKFYPRTVADNRAVNALMDWSEKFAKRQ